MNVERQAMAPIWPGDPATLEAGDVDFEALAHVLANTCCWGGRSRRFYSVAQYAMQVSAAVDRLGRMDEAGRRVLGLHALLADAPMAWTGFWSAPGADASGAAAPESAKAAERLQRTSAAVRRAVLEAAGLEPELPADWAEALKFIRRMAEAALYRDLHGAGIADGGVGVAGAGPLFPPLKQRIRPMPPDRAAKKWLERFAELRAGLPARGIEPGGNGGGEGATRQ